MMMDSEEEEEQTALVCDNGKFGATAKEIWSETCRTKKDMITCQTVDFKKNIREMFDDVWQ